jgi:hypothetical protein
VAKFSIAVICSRDVGDENRAYEPGNKVEIIEICIFLLDTATFFQEAKLEGVLTENARQMEKKPVNQMRGRTGTCRCLIPDHQKSIMGMLQLAVLQADIGDRSANKQHPHYNHRNR